MCRMMAKLSIEETTIANEMLHCPYSLQYLSEKGDQLGSEEIGFHKDGCGLGYVQDNELVIEKRGSSNAWDKSYVNAIITAKSKFFAAHNRLSSLFLNNKSDVSGAQPFGKSGYLFCHNGEIKTFAEEANKMATTDSFIFFSKLIDGAPVTIDSVRERLIYIAANTKYNSMCGFLGNENELFGWRIYKGENSNEADSFEKYFTLNVSLQKSHVIISSQKLNAQHNEWTNLPNNTLVHVKPNGLKMELKTWDLQ